MIVLVYGTYFPIPDISGVACLMKFLFSLENQYIEQNWRLGRYKISMFFWYGRVSYQEQNILSISYGQWICYVFFLLMIDHKFYENNFIQWVLEF